MTRFVVVFFGVCLVLYGSGCVRSDTADAETAERNSTLYRQAFSAEQSGSIDDAIRLYNKVLIEEPKSFSAHFQLATLLHDYKEDYIGAIYHYRQYVYLRPDADKCALAKERVRIAEQLLAPQILRKVEDSVQGISQAHLLKENDRLNRIITTLEGQKSVLTEAKVAAEGELEKARADNARLHTILGKMRVDGQSSGPSESVLKRVDPAVLKPDSERPSARPDSKALRALREEAAALSAAPLPAEPRKPAAEMPSTESMLKKVQTRLTAEPVRSEAAVAKPVASAAKPAAPAVQPVAPAKPAAPAVQPVAPAAKPAVQSEAPVVKPAVQSEAAVVKPVVPAVQPVTPAKPAAPAVQPAAAAEPSVQPEPKEKTFKPSKALASMFGKDDKKDKNSRVGGEPRTYVVQPGDTLFRVAEKFYGDSTLWKRIRDANRTRIDPDGRIRAGQIISVP